MANPAPRAAVAVPKDFRKPRRSHNLSTAGLMRIEPPSSNLQDAQEKTLKTAPSEAVKNRKTNNTNWSAAVGPGILAWPWLQNQRLTDRLGSLSLRCLPHALFPLILSHLLTVAAPLRVCVFGDGYRAATVRERSPEPPSCATGGR